jgi:hypothetical protein
MIDCLFGNLKKGKVYMATSGSISKSHSHITVTLSWSRTSVDIANNRSTISYSLVINRPYAINSSASKSYSIVFNGTTVASGTTTIGGTGSKTIKSGSVVIPHNADGTKSFGYSFSQQLDISYNGWVGTLSNSGTGVLDSIARASQPSLNVSTQNIGSAITIYTNKASSFTHTLKYSFGSASGTIATGVVDSYSWTLPNSLANQIPSATSGWGTISCETYNGGTHIGTKSVTFTANVPNTATFNPSIASLGHSETNSAVSTVGGYVQGLSKIKFTMNTPKAEYGATIKSYQITFDGGSWNSNTATTDAVKGSGTMTATATIIDSRGRTATKTASVTVLAYSPPLITNFTAQRINMDTEDVDPLGTLINFRINGTYTTLSGKNTVRTYVDYKVRGGTTWADASFGGYPASTTGVITHNENSDVGGGFNFDPTKSYEFRLRSVDKWNTTMVLATVSTAQVTMSWGRTGVGIGKVWEQGVLDVGGNAYIEGSLTLLGSKIPLTSNNDGTTNIITGLDLNNVTETGFYMGENLSNAPIAKANGQWVHLQVMKHNASFQIQVAYDFWTNRIWFRRRTSGSWTRWMPITHNEMPVLWTGGHMMTSGQTIYPSKKLSECANGWVLTFSQYNGGSVDNEMNYTFIPKSAYIGVQAHNIIGVSGWGIASKYMRVYDDRLQGNDGNSTDPRGRAVLRAVHEW